VRVLPRRELLLVDFEVGASPDALVPRISVRVRYRTESSCIATLMVWRMPEQDDESWQRVRDLHRAEIHLIKGRLELGF
jgi:hypothetical protein